MRITLVLANLNYGGAERVTLNLANHLAKNNYIEILTKDTNGPLSTLANKQIFLTTPKSIFPWPISMLIHIKKNKPDIIFSTFWDISCTLIIARKLLFPLSKIITRDSVSPEGHLKTLPFYRIKTLIYKYCYPKSDAIIALSNALASEAENICKKKLPQLNIIRNPIPTIKNEKRKKNLPYISLISIGRLEHQKGFDILISATSLLIKKHHKIKLTIIGDGPDKSMLQNLCKQKGIQKYVKFTGSIKDKESLLSASDIYVLSSRYEGVSNAMLEAIGLGLPVVATSMHTSASEYIKNKYNGILVAETSTESLATGIEQAINTNLWPPQANHPSHKQCNLLQAYEETIKTI